jgi:hypothetical protein
MYCGNCGTPVGDTAKFCPKCGNRIPRPGVPNDETVGQTVPGSEPVEQAPISNEAPAWQEGSEPAWQDSSAEENSAWSGNSEPAWQGSETPYDSSWQEEPSPEGPEKKHSIAKRSITLGVALAAVILVVIAGFLNASALANFATKTFASPASYYQYVEAKALGNTVSTIASIYDVVLRDNLQVDDRSASLDATLTLKSGAQDLLTNYSGTDFSWLSSIGMSVAANSKDDLSSTSASLSLGSDQLISCNVITDLDSGSLYFQVPELSQDYAEISLEDLLGDYYYDTDAMDQVLDTLTDLYERSPDKDTVEKILTRYVKLALSCLDDVYKDSDTLSAEGVSKKYTTLEVTIDTDVLQDVLESVLNEMLEDEDLEEIILNFAELAETEDVDAEDIYDEFTDALEELLDELDELDDYNMDDIVMTVWVDGSGEIRGREIKYEDAVLVYAMPKDGKDFGLELSYSEGDEYVALTGSGTISGGKLSGDFTLSETEYGYYEDEDGAEIPLLDLEVDQWDTDKFQDGYLSGTVTLAPKSGLNNMLTSFKLTVSADTDKNSANYEISASSDGLSLGTLALSSKTGSSTGSVKAPADTVSLSRWTSTVDITGFLSSLRDTDIPSDLLDELIEELLYYY